MNDVIPWVATFAAVLAAGYLLRVLWNLGTLLEKKADRADAQAMATLKDADLLIEKEAG